MRKDRRTKVLGWRWRQNPLRRHSDAVEAWIVLVTWALATIGGVTAGAVSAQGTENALTRGRAERQEVSAVLLETAPAGLRDMTTGAAYSQVQAEVRWTDGNGTVRTDNAKVRAGTKAGATVPVWTDGHGRLVPDPMSRAEAQARAMLTGSGVGALGGLVVLAGGRLARLRIERRATERWGEEWARVGPRWGRRTG
ncbi:Rv1733c family protein [Streptomyces tauricus]